MALEEVVTWSRGHVVTWQRMQPRREPSASSLPPLGRASMKPTHSLRKVTPRRKYINKHAEQGRKTVGDVFALVWAALGG